MKLRWAWEEAFVDARQRPYVPFRQVREHFGSTILAFVYMVGVRVLKG